MSAWACASPGRGRRRAETNKHETAVNHDTSYRDAEFFVALARRVPGVRAIYLQRLHKRDAQGLEQLNASALLTIHAGDFLNPSNPLLVDH